jgi:hypothetical protein
MMLRQRAYLLSTTAAAFGLLTSSTSSNQCEQISRLASLEKRVIDMQSKLDPPVMPEQIFERSLVDALSGDQWKHLDEHGWVKLGRVLSATQLKVLQQRIDAIMLGKAKGLEYEKMLMQLDSPTGRYEDIGEQTFGHKGGTLNYRKIQNLERDPYFMAYCKLPVFEEICRAMYGSNEPIASFRTMFFNKPVSGGTPLPWHQDRWIHLDKDPKVTMYTAIDSATVENGCVQLIPGSHKLGVVNPSHHSAFLTEDQAQQYCPEDKIGELQDYSRVLARALARGETRGERFPQRGDQQLPGPVPAVRAPAVL